MNWSMFFEESDFVSFTKFHFIPILLFLILGIVASYIGSRLHSEKAKTKLGFALALIPFISLILTFCLRLYEGFDVKQDLPFHLCRALCLMMPFVMLIRNRFWLGVSYFWIIVGTLNANITPDIEFGYPHYDYFNYWLQHSGLIILPIYAIFVYELRIKWRDFFNAYIGVNLFLVLSLIVNFILKSNYMYSSAKPPSGSLLDYMGPWPWYLITGQALAIGLCGIAIVPFLIFYRIKK